MLLWAVGFVFETVGDLQLTRFRNDPASRGQVLDTGLWRYTRHPNYFGDACVWWGLSLVAFSAWPGVLTILSPLVMTWFLAKGTGKPLLEKDMASRRPGYADYVRRTSGFVPLPPKKPTQGDRVKTLTEGASAPDFELADQDGRQVRLSERLESGPVVLFFYPVALSGGCTKEACRFRDLGAPSSSGPAPSGSASAWTPSPSRRTSTRPTGSTTRCSRTRPARSRRRSACRRMFVTPVKRATFVIDRDRTLRTVVTSEMNMDVHADRALAALGAL